ncbi:microfibrillar-associated protein 1-like [Iris pallida]|uniref:Microfibrillar-associated protein 1-like n=1 Tax=Iris pallida TaxID=29817 RepID=A0AAX6FKX2_IRIPA|nr:microfibrillar-associated protein 1-like [Iris pallida]KAJ6816979.1 microfibrillar-associated protein 1-like [Iris pallida]
MSVTAGVSEAAIAVRDKLRGKIGQTKVKRYWPGKAPEWAEDADEELLDDIKKSSSSSFSLEKAFPSHEHDPGVVPKADDRRLRRLAESRSEKLDEVRADHRRIRQAEIVSTIEEEEEDNQRRDAEDDDEDAREERRRRIREKQLQREQEEAALLPDEPEEEELDEEEEESEYETDSEEEQTGIAMVKPVFIPKSQRDTIAERERLEEEERKLEQLVKKRLEERKVETKQIVVEEIRKDEEIRKNLETEANIADVDTDDELNEAEEYEAWKAREIARIKRDREDREARLKEREEIEKVRNMTEEERREWERKNPKPQSAPKQKWRFMQKYYHKGAFFQSENDDRAATAGSDDIYRRDFSEPTGEDKMDKTILPKVMQVKHFGRSGRTKWTHLVNEDTTDWNNPWTANGPLRAKYNTKMAGLNAPIEKPKGSKKLKDWGTS